MPIPASFLENLTALKDQRVLVTGGAGFLGRHMVELLLQCECREIIVFDVVKPNPAFPAAVTAVVGNLLNAAELQPLFTSLYAVFHVASPNPLANDPKLFHDVNVNGTRNVITACREGHVPRLVYTSSASVVFDGTDQRNWDERSPIPKRGLDAYTRSKYAGEQLIVLASDESLFTAAIRPHGIFGPRDPALITSLHKTALSGKNKYQIGDGSNLADFTYVENVTYAHLLVCTQLGPKATVNGQTYFITNRQPVLFWHFFTRLYNELGFSGPHIKLPFSIMLPLATVMEAVKSIVPSLPIPISFTVKAITYTGKAHYYSCARAVREFGYFPPIELEEGIRRTMASFPHLQRGNWKEKDFTAYTGLTTTNKWAIGTAATVLLFVLFAGSIWRFLVSLSLWYSFVLVLHVGLLLRFLYQQTSFGKPTRPFKEQPDLASRTIVVTGSNKGIGFETALQLARLKASIIVACRNEQLGKQAVERIQRRTNNPNISYMHLDLDSFASVKAFVASLSEQAMTVDCLIHNAAAMVEKGVSQDGNDKQLQCNYLSSFLLTQLVTNSNILTADARVVNVSSFLHRAGHINLADLNSEKAYNRLETYNNTKLMQVAFTFRLQRHFDQLAYSALSASSPNSTALPLSRRTAIAVNPGAVISDFHYHFAPKWAMDAIQPLLAGFLTKTVQVGAWPVVWAAVASELVGVGGVYTDNCAVAVASDEANSRPVQDALWDKSMELVRKQL